MFRTAKLSQLDEFDEIIDVRTPAEFAEDHIPGAINCPVLSDAERITVGTLYMQQSPFEARKVGAALVAKNIAEHLQTRFCDHPKSWKPLIYCWRGGQRSGAMTIILNQVGWAAHKLEGGYKTYRYDVRIKLENFPENLKLKVICGPTGSGKSRLLHALAERGQQVLDLEALAKHRGSVLGRWPEHAQPSQKGFEGQFLQVLQTFDLTRPVYVEAESNKIGRITLPNSLVNAMHSSDCLLLDTALEVRVAGLLDDYLHYLNDPELLITHLQALYRFHGAKLLEHWTAQIRGGDFAALVGELLTLHYDPSYLRATLTHYPLIEQAQRISLVELSGEYLKRVAASL
jgi:tRNA 2-selenouridine synthase